MTNGEARRSTDETEEYNKFAADITFGGLCLVRVGKWRGSPQGDPRPKQAREIEVLLVPSSAEGGIGGEHDHESHHGSAHLHYPRLNYYAEDDLALRSRPDRWDGVLLPSPEGKEVVSVDLSYKRVEVIPPWNYGKDWKWSELRWCRNVQQRYPKDPDQDDRLDWVLQSGQTGLASVDPRKAITVVTGLPGTGGRPGLPNGQWRTLSIHRNREVRTQRAILWRIGSIKGSRAIAREVVLHLPELSAGLTLRISNLRGDPDPYEIVLTPGGKDRLRLSISNLPRVLGSPWESHWGMFSSLGSGNIVDVVQDDHVVCVGVPPCDNKLHFEQRVK